MNKLEARKNCAIELIEQADKNIAVLEYLIKKEKRCKRNFEAILRETRKQILDLSN
jgi:hypothetical protein